MFKVKSSAPPKALRAGPMLAAYKSLRTIAIAEDDDYKVVIKDIRPELRSNSHQKGLVFFIRKSDKTMVWCGCWMDWPEDHWDICPECYHHMPRNQRARLEAHEQLQYWVREEFEDLIGRD